MSGKEFNTDNAVIYVDRSGGAGDTEDPLTLNFIFPNGHQEYINFFCNVADGRKN